jgi:hypothetical protein
MTTMFVFTCGCQSEEFVTHNNSSRSCPNHPQRSIKEVHCTCEVCNAAIVYKPGSYKAHTLHLCREHKIIRERFMSFYHNCKAAGKPLPVWEQYHREFNNKNSGKLKPGPRH